MSSFPYFELSGSPQEIGQQAGNKFGDRIRSNFAFYEKFFADLLKISPDNFARSKILKKELRRISLDFGLIVKNLFPRLDTEICAMAKAANMEEWQIYLLNARTEIYRILKQTIPVPDVGECTSLYFPKSKVLGQNWDWHPRLEELCVITKITLDSGKSFVMLTEPGIIGKIGLNSDGLGVCLNILFSDCGISGVPVHIMLRGILESGNLSEAKLLIERLPRGTTSNFLIADSSGQALDIELKGQEMKTVSLTDGELIHTNHYFGDELSASASLPGSIERLNRAEQLYKDLSEHGIEGMKKILCDKENETYPICRSYAMGLDFMVGTVASMIMDLEARELHLVKGQPQHNSSWHTYNA